MKQDLNTLCQQIAHGRQLARALSAALNGQELNESEFRLLWLLASESERAGDARLEQRALAERLGISTGQVSAVVERLCGRQLIARITDEQDRRRQLWQLTTPGRKFFSTLSSVVDSALFEDRHASIQPLSLREEAA